MLTGSSGSGKSTFLRLIGKLQEGTYQGNIRINGILLEEINMDSLYGKMGIVFQEPYLFGFSLKENIIMGRNVKDSDYEAILKKLNLGYLLERFSDVELDTEMVASSANSISSISRAFCSSKEEVISSNRYTCGFLYIDDRQ